jgi:phosphohistidine swiveling domain-containing protein
MTGSFRGRVACGGYASGPLHVAYDDEAIAECPVGAVLALPTASPSLILALRRAVAVVSETGGVVSHAAIIAREFGLPCVVAVPGIAAVEFHGRMAEVFASDGLVLLHD